MGYNLRLNQVFSSILVNIENYHFYIFIPSPLPSIQQIGVLNMFHISGGAFNYTWAGITAYGAFLFLGGLVTAGFLGFIKDGIRNRKPSLKTFFQFAWYYGPRFFLLLLFGGLFVSLISLLGGYRMFGLIVAFFEIVFILVPYVIIMEDYGIAEALVSAPLILFRYFKPFSLLFLGEAFLSTIFSALVNLSQKGWPIALFIWPYLGTSLVYDIMLLYHDIVLKQPLSETPREHLRGYGQSFLKTLILILVVILVLGFPTVLSKSRYFPVLMPWHHPVIEREGYVYQTDGSLVISPHNRFKKVKLVIDSLSPSKDDILYTKPGFIKGKGRVIAAGFKPVYFTFELARASGDDHAVYSLQNGGRVEATDGIWGNPVERGMILAISGDLKNVSGVIYDKRDYSEFSTLWSPEKDVVFLGPMRNKKDLYGFYASEKVPKTPVEFQWVYDRALPVQAGEKDPISIMEKINTAFESLDLDLLLKMLYYVSDLKPENVLSILQEKFSHYTWDMKVKGLENWENNVKSDVSYYPVSGEKIILVGDYRYLENTLGFRAELYKIGERWKITRMIIREGNDE